MPLPTANCCHESRNTPPLLAAEGPIGWELPGVLAVAVSAYRIHPGGRQDLLPDVGQHLVPAREGGSHAAICRDSGLGSQDIIQDTSEAQPPQQLLGSADPQTPLQPVAQAGIAEGGLV